MAVSWSRTAPTNSSSVITTETRRGIRAAETTPASRQQEITTKVTMSAETSSLSLGNFPFGFDCGAEIDVKNAVVDTLKGMPHGTSMRTRPHTGWVTSSAVMRCHVVRKKVGVLGKHNALAQVSERGLKQACWHD